MGSCDWLLSRSFAFDDDRLARAIAATFAKRRTPLPTELPDALTLAFALDEQKQQQWQAFANEVAHDPGSLAEVVSARAVFLMRHTAAAAKMTS
jgi:hypothetical protein